MADPQLRCSCYRLRRAARLVTQMYDAAFEPLGITTTQFSIMSDLSRSGPVAISALAERLGMDRTTMTRTLKPLERAGLIKPAPNDDRRVHAVELSQKGAETFMAGVPLWRDAESRIARDLGAGGVEQLYGLLSAVENTALTVRHSEDRAPVAQAASRA